MATLTELKSRARAIDWRVNKAAQGEFHVTSGDGEKLRIFTSSTEVEDAIARVELALRSDDATRQERRKAETKLASERATRQQAALKLARGDYATPERIDLDWATAPHPAPWAKWVIIYPEDAQALLETNTENRAVRKKTRGDYAKDIEKKHWRLTHQAMAMDTRGILQDGQHRALGCVDSGEPISVLFCVGMDPDNFAVVDTHAKRNFRDVLPGHIDAHPATLAASLRLIAAVERLTPDKNDLVAAFNYGRLTHSDLMELAEQYPRLAELSYPMYQLAMRPRIRLNAPGITVARYLIEQGSGEDHPFIEPFFEGMEGWQGDRGLIRSDPRSRLADWLDGRREGNRRVSAADALIATILAWNAVANDRSLQFIRTSEVMPPLVKVKKNAPTPSFLIPG